jgi:trans-aconitate 2-methyltransferase
MTSDPWSPQQYERFRRERRQPFVDLLALVRPKPNMRVVDLGCGTGELTQELHHRLKARETLGVDSSESMLAEAKPLSGRGLHFERADIGSFEAGEYDLIFSNAALHWVPEHGRLLAKLTDALTRDGQLAVQVPANFDHPSHTVASEVASASPFHTALGGFVHPRHVLEPEAYTSLLDGLGYREREIRIRVYDHHLASRAEVVEWVKGSLLTAYQRRMPDELFQDFIECYRERLLPLLEDTRPFFFPFKRILFWGQG